MSEDDFYQTIFQLERHRFQDLTPEEAALELRPLLEEVFLQMLQDMTNRGWLKGEATPTVVSKNHGRGRTRHVSEVFSGDLLLAGAVPPDKVIMLAMVSKLRMMLDYRGMEIRPGHKYELRLSLRVGEP